MNLPAIRHSARQVPAYFFALMTVVEVWAYVDGPVEQRPLALLAAAFGALATAWCFAARYLDHEREQRRAERAAAYIAEREQQLAEVERLRTERETRTAEAVGLGLRCPDDCASCDDERRESDLRMAEFLAERARRHGHPIPADPSTLDA